MEQVFDNDVIVLSSHHDNELASDLALHLISEGLSVWANYDGDRPGRALKNTIESELEDSCVLVLLMSKSTFGPEWSTLEGYTALFRSADEHDRHFIPVLVEDVEIPEPLRQYNYIDWRDRSSSGYDRIVELCIVFSRRDSDEEEVPELAKTEPEKILKAHQREIARVVVAADGRTIVSSAQDNKVRVWDGVLETFKIEFAGHSDYVYGLAITPDGNVVVSGSDDSLVKVWSIKEQTNLAVLKGHKGWVRSVAITPDGKTVVSGSDDRSVRIWDVNEGTCRFIFDGHNSIVRAVAVSGDGNCVVSGSDDGRLRCWDLVSGQTWTFDSGFHRFREAVFVNADSVLLKTFHDSIFLWKPREETISSISGRTFSLHFGSLVKNSKQLVYVDDLRVHLYDLEKGRDAVILEGHTSDIEDAVGTSDGEIIVSVTDEGEIRAWDIQTGECLHHIFVAPITLISAIIVDRDLIISGFRGGSISFWKFVDVFGRTGKTTKEIRYTNAKVLLVGETGVGKSGIARRLVENRFIGEVSTDGVWASQMKLGTNFAEGDAEREIWLWDFAGQSDYRLIHQLYMDETSLAVLIFNPQQENPFEGLGQWDRDIERAAGREFKKLLVAGRIDRGGLMVSRKSIDAFKLERHFADYVETSAKTGTGCLELKQAILENIDWESIPYTSSPQIFKVLKEQILKLKDEGKTLLRLSELKQQLGMVLPEETFTIDALNAVIGLLAGPGLIKKLEFGDFVLLRPEIINSYAAAVFRSVRAHTDEIGCIDEARVLDGDIDYQDLRRLIQSEEEIVLRAMLQMLVARGICLREPSGAGILLVFPALFKRERPEIGGHPSAFVTYEFSGQMEEIYSTLVVKLSYSSIFAKDQLWKFAADFKTLTGKRVGLKMRKQGEGRAALTVYFEPDIADDTKVAFVQYVHEHLRHKGENLRRLRHYVCLKCGTPVTNQDVVEEKIANDMPDIVCIKCESRILLWDVLEEKFASLESRNAARVMLNKATISIDNESRELILVGHAFAMAGEAGQIFRPTANSDWGIDGEIEFKDHEGKASGKRVYLQFKSGDSYLTTRKRDKKEIFYIKNERHAKYWVSQAYPVMLVIRSSDGEIRWMNVTEYLENHGIEDRQIVFGGEPFNAVNVLYMRDRMLNV